MEYEHLAKGLVITFEDPVEVAAVSRAFQEHNEYQRSRGNSGSVVAYHDFVAEWEGGFCKAYRASTDATLVEKLEHFVETTDEKVDDILESDDPERLDQAARRYELSHEASALLVKLGAQFEPQASQSDALEN